MDFYRECLVEKVLTPKERYIRFAAWGAISFVLFVLFVFGILIYFSDISLVARILFFVGVVLLVMDKYYFNKFVYKLSFKLEYEYTLTNSTLDIDKIIAKSERSRLISFDVKEIELMSPMSLIESREYDGSFKTVAEACADLGDLEGTYCVIADTDRYGRLRLVFTPNEDMLNMMSSMLGNKLRKKK